jgi:hypothetical protein
VAAAAVGLVQARAQKGRFFRATAALSAPELSALEAAPVLSAANVAWALGDVASVKSTLESVMERVPDGARRAQAFVRFGLIDSNFDGQAAVFGQACAADARYCDAGLERAAEREAKLRFVAPGNHLPLYFGGHPPIPGAK